MMELKRLKKISDQEFDRLATWHKRAGEMMYIMNETARHRYDQAQVTETLNQFGVENVEHISVLEGLALNERILIGCKQSISTSKESIFEELRIN